MELKRPSLLRGGLLIFESEKEVSLIPSVFDRIYLDKFAVVPDVIRRAIVRFGSACCSGGAFDSFGRVDDQEFAVEAKTKAQVCDKGREDHTACSRVDNGELLAFFAAKPPHNGLVARKIGTDFGTVNQAVFESKRARMAHEIDRTRFVFVNLVFGNRKLFKFGFFSYAVQVLRVTAGRAYRR